jgi:hypothetical protein
MGWRLALALITGALPSVRARADEPFSWPVDLTLGAEVQEIITDNLTSASGGGGVSSVTRFGATVGAGFPRGLRKLNASYGASFNYTSPVAEDTERIAMSHQFSGSAALRPGAALEVGARASRADSFQPTRSELAGLLRHTDITYEGRLSWTIPEWIAVSAAFARTNVDFGEENAMLQAQNSLFHRVATEANFRIHVKMSVFASVSYTLSDYQGTGDANLSRDSKQWFLRGGIEGRPSPSVQMTAAGGYQQASYENPGLEPVTSPWISLGGTYAPSPLTSFGSSFTYSLVDSFFGRNLHYHSALAELNASRTVGTRLAVVASVSGEFGVYKQLDEQVMKVRLDSTLRVNLGARFRFSDRVDAGFKYTRSARLSNFDEQSFAENRGVLDVTWQY